jgi:hypothetical protein
VRKIPDACLENTLIAREAGEFLTPLAPPQLVSPDIAADASRLKD